MGRLYMALKHFVGRLQIYYGLLLFLRLDAHAWPRICYDPCHPTSFTTPVSDIAIFVLKRGVKLQLIRLQHLPVTKTDADAASRPFHFATCLRHIVYLAATSAGWFVGTREMQPRWQHSILSLSVMAVKNIIIFLLLMGLTFFFWFCIHHPSNTTIVCKFLTLFLYCTPLQRHGRFCMCVVFKKTY